MSTSSPGAGCSSAPLTRCDPTQPVGSDAMCLSVLNVASEPVTVRQDIQPPAQPICFAVAPYQTVSYLVPRFSTWTATGDVSGSVLLGAIQPASPSAYVVAGVVRTNPVPFAPNYSVGAAWALLVVWVVLGLVISLVMRGQDVDSARGRCEAVFGAGLCTPENQKAFVGRRWVVPLAVTVLGATLIGLVLAVYYRLLYPTRARYPDCVARGDPWVNSLPGDTWGNILCRATGVCSCRNPDMEYSCTLKGWQQAMENAAQQGGGGQGGIPQPYYRWSQTNADYFSGPSDYVRGRPHPFSCACCTLPNPQEQGVGCVDVSVSGDPQCTPPP